jgi:integrase
MSKSRIKAGTEAAAWPYVAGHKGTNRVRVYHRGSTIWVDIHSEDGRERRPLRVGGVPITSKANARTEAQKLAARLLSKPLQAVLGTMSGPPKKTMDDLAVAYRRAQEAKGPDPSGHRTRKARTADRLANIVGRERVVRSLSAETILQAITTWADERGRATRTRRTYQEVAREMMRLARKKGWLASGSDATEIQPVPQQSGRYQSYSPQEAEALLAVAAQIDPRLEAYIRIAIDTGRRAQAILQLEIGDIDASVIAGHTVMQIEFRAELDKRSRPGIAVVTEETAAAVWTLRGDRGTGEHLFEGTRGALPYWHYNQAHEALLAAEIAAGVPRIANRGAHGLKRRAVTDMVHAHGYAFASDQSGTSIRTLRDRYVEARIPELARGAAALAAHRKRAD